MVCSFVGYAYVQSQSKELFKCYLELGHQLENLYVAYEHDKRYGPWSQVLKEKCQISTSYSRKLRALAKLLQPFPKFSQLSVSMFEMHRLKPRIEKMLQVEDIKIFWLQQE